jgi:O-antigen ligase
MGRLVFSPVSPAFPAAWLLFGLTFAMAAAHFLSLSWPRLATVAVYSIPLVLCLLILRNRNGLRTKLNLIDAVFAVFILVVLISATIFPGPDEHGDVWQYLRYLPFLMITPYVLGRLMSFKDLELFSRITLFAGLALLPLLALDRLIVVDRAWRLPVFGLDHGPLLVGGLLAAMLLVLCTRALSSFNSVREAARLERYVELGLIGCVTVVLVWLLARGWLLAGLAGVAVVCLVMSSRSPALRGGLAAYVFAIATIALLILPQSSFYAAILTAPASITEFCPVLGDASCQPFRDGVDSVAMRWVMYREAVALFMQNPIWGVGAARFGDCSCTGPGWYPHNTILQGFAELGFIGGGLQLGLFVLAAVALLQPLMSVRQDGSEGTYAFVLALFAMFLVSDQFYGTYFMTAGTWLMIGIAASLHSKANEESSHA